MARTALIYRRLRCTACSHRWRAQFWTRREMPSGKIFEPSYYDLRCPECGALPSQFADDEPKRAAFFTQLRGDARPVVYRWLDDRGHEHFRYPARNDGPQRPSEERVEFSTLREMTTFLKEQNPGYRDWNQPLNDILDYDEAHIDIPALDTTDPGVADEAAEIAACADEGAGVTTESEVSALMSDTSARTLIENH